MGATSLPDQTLVSLNGIDATTGAPYGAALSAEELGLSIVREQIDPDLVGALRARAQSAKPTFGVRAGVNPCSLAEAGWGAIFPCGCPQEIIDSLKPLLEHRRAHAGSRFRLYTGANGFQAGDTSLKFLQRHSMGPGQANPAKVPYYLLLVGGPDRIPLDFQYGLDVDYAVGRIGFDSPAGYVQYARSIVEQENARTTNRRIVLFPVENPGDEATARSTADLMDTLSRGAPNWAGSWAQSVIEPAQASKQRLSAELHSQTAPGILFTASHGVGFPCGHEKQVGHQGAILCRDWPGQSLHRGPIPEAYYFSGDDLLPSANVQGSIAFLFCCYGAGTPREDYFPEQSDEAGGKGAGLNRRQIAERDFLARLPLRMLTHPRGSARAVVAHIERAWTYSFSWPQVGPQVEPYEDALRLLIEGAPIGLAMEGFGARYASLSTSIASLMDLLRSSAGFKPNPVELGSLWTARNDARSFIILGDPATRFVEH